MDRLLKIIYKSVFSASRHPWWWLFALVQTAAFSAVGQLGRIKILSTFTNALLILSFVLAATLLAPLTIWFWQNICAHEKLTSEVKFDQRFIGQSLSGVKLVLLAVILITMARLAIPFWPFHTLAFAVVSSSAGLALLYVALSGQSLPGALRLTVDTWNKKISFSVTAALVLIFAHGISYSLVHGVFGNFYLFREFPVFGHSATIWILLLVLTVLIGYLSAILNSFVVFLFLDTIARKKDPEAEKVEVMEPVKVGAI